MIEVREDRIRIAVTGLAWMENGVRSINSLLEESFPKATKEVQVVAYRITRGSGEFLRGITDCLHRGLRVSILINRFDKQSAVIKNQLLKLSKEFPQHFTLLDFCPENTSEDLHAKTVVFDRASVYVGSSNITWRGLIRNHELGLFIEGPTAARIGNLIDTISRDPRSKILRL